ncbi:MAG: energy transducer TonB [Sulfurovaceae bacterium]|nr:energy transducer TonB [Sulfurovaceae bacterium]
MTNTHYGSSFLISASVYTLIALLYLSFTDDIVPLKPKLKPEVIKIALIMPVIKKKEIKKVEPKVEKPKPTPKPKKKKIVKKKIIKKEVIKKPIVKKPVIKNITPPKPKPTLEIIQPELYYPPVIQEVLPEPVIEPIIEPIVETFVEEPVYYEPPPIYQEVVAQEVYYEQPPVPLPVVNEKVPYARQEYIINDPIVEPPPIAIAPPTTAIKSDFTNEKRAFKRETRDIINSNKRYPTMAKRRHIQGTVHVVFDILSNGEIFNIRTSGASTILQKAARKSVMKSSPLNVPSVLENQFPMNNVSVNIDFQLQ